MLISFVNDGTSRSSGVTRATSVLLLLLATSEVRAQDVTLPVVLARLHRYLGDYAELLPATIAAERYHQSVGSSERVVLESEFGIVRVPNHPQWLGFRDVVTVNGKAWRVATGVWSRCLKISP